MRGYRSPALSLLLFAALILVTACGGSEGATGVEPDPAVAPFVGDWRATEFTVTSTQNAEVFFDLTDGGAFTINVQPSGLYTAIVEFPQLPAPVVEIGQLSVAGSSITLRPQGGTAATSSYSFDGPNRFSLDGPTQFDFNNDGTLDPATAFIRLQRASSQN